MATEWMAYWRSKQFREAYENASLETIGSRQFKEVGVGPGDRIWIVSAPGRRKLVTIGYVRVRAVLSRRQAERELGTSLFDAPWHAVHQGSPVIPKIVDITRIAPQLRFEGTDRDRLPWRSGREHVSQSLRRMRRLTPKSAAGLSKAFTSGVDLEDRTLQEDLDHGDLHAFDVDGKGKRRGEQGVVRDRVLGRGHESSCAICGGTYPLALLVAAHIKPRAKCTQPEKNDWRRNVVPMCVLGCDALFERGRIVVKDGRVVVTGANGRRGLLRSFASQVDGRKIDRTLYRNGHIYFDWHHRTHTD